MQKKILDTALELSTISGFEKLNLQDIAKVQQISLCDIYQHYRSKDELIEAWFTRADLAMLNSHINDIYLPEERIEQAITTWLTTLAPYQNITRDMICYKLKPLDLQNKLNGYTRLKHTISWIRDVAKLEADGFRRCTQELALSHIFLSVFLYWLNDTSDKQERSARLLKSQLKIANLFGLWR